MRLLFSSVASFISSLIIDRLIKPSIVARYLNDRGTLAEERWKALEWSAPVNETDQCWWLVILVKICCVVLVESSVRLSLSPTTTLPLTHMSSSEYCFVIVAQVNAREADKTKAPTLIPRSVGLLRVELTENQVASTAKLSREFEKRSADNSTACDVLHNHQHLWASVGGPQVESLFRPGIADIEQAKECCDMLQQMRERDDPDAIIDH